MHSWKKITLADCCQKVTSGGTPSRANTNFYINGTIPWIKTGELHDSKVFGDDVSEWITLEALNNSSAKLFPKNTILMAMYGDGKTIGTLGIIQQPSASNQACSALIANSSVCLPKFLFYALIVWRDGLIRLAYGGAQRNLTSKLIQQYQISVPGMDSQKKIAAILSTYDDLIENNLKRIKLLEEMVQITYEEWFVRLKFPGYETAPIDLETGLPMSWEKRKLRDFCEEITDGTHESPKEVEEGFKLVTGKHILNGFIDFDTAYSISKEDHINIKKRSGLNKGDILFSNIGTLGNIGVVTQDFEFSCKNVVIFKYKKGFNNFLYAYLSNKNTKNKLSGQSAGVAQKFYSLKFIRNFDDFFPPNELIEDFDGKVKSYYELKYNLHTQNQLLKEARDILLPRLMTGMIDLDSMQFPGSLPIPGAHLFAKY